MVTQKKGTKVNKPEQVQVTVGNIPQLTIQLLHDMNQNLIKILEELKRG